MPRIDTAGTLPGRLSIWVYTDHMPPHFHVRSPNSNAQIDLRTLQVMRGRISRKDYAAVIDWASVPGNREALDHAWSRLNDED